MRNKTKKKQNMLENTEVKNKINDKYTKGKSKTKTEYESKN